MRMYWKCVPQNRALLIAQVTQCLPDYRGRTFGIGIAPAGESVTLRNRYARNLPSQQLTFARKRDPAVSAPAMARRFSAKNKLRIAGEMSCQPSQLCIRTIAGLAVGAMVAPWVEQRRRECGLQCIGQAFGQFGIGYHCPAPVVSAFRGTAGSLFPCAERLLQRQTNKPLIRQPRAGRALTHGVIEILGQ